MVKKKNFKIIRKPHKNLIGERFDKLVVIKRGEDYIYPSSGKHEYKWLCKCDCGNTIEVIQHNLLNGHTHCCKECKSNAFKDITGQKFGKLTVIKRGPDYEYSGGKDVRWYCKCDCGNEILIRGNALRSGHTISCGCAISEAATKHGWHGTRIYNILHSMKQRCYNKNHKAYKDYGGRGIKICDEWLDPDTGVNNFCNWAYANGYKDSNDLENKLSIERKDVNGNYCPENCTFVNAATQANNRRNNVKLTFNGITHTIAEWEPIVGIPAFTMYARKVNGWNDEAILTTPINNYMKILTDSKGNTHTISEWSEITGLRRELIYDRYFRQNWSADASLYTPVSDSRKPKFLVYNGDAFSYNQWDILTGFGSGTISHRVLENSDTNKYNSTEEIITTLPKNNGKITKSINVVYFIDPETKKGVPQNQVIDDKYNN